MQTTLEKLREHRACYDGYNRVVRMLQGLEFDGTDYRYRGYLAHPNALVDLADIAGNNGIEDAIWALRCIEGCDRDIRLFAAWCARQVEGPMSHPASIEAISVAERFANGLASSEELRIACDAAFYATYDCDLDDASMCAFYSAEVPAQKSAANAYFRAADVDATVSDRLREMFIKLCRGEAPWQIKGE